MPLTAQDIDLIFAQKVPSSFQADRVCIDSRKVQPGDLFVAIKGDHQDGHDYVQQAFEKGAIAALVTHPPTLSAHKDHLLLVPDTLHALEKIGQYQRSRFQGTVIGLTGSAGKTSIKEGLRYILSTFATTYSTEGNYNNHIGLPLMLANLPQDAAYAVFEMGMNHAGEIEHLIKQVQPNIGLITNVYPIHMGFFKDLKEIALAKCEIWQGVQKTGFALINENSEYADLQKQEARQQHIQHVITFGHSQVSDLHETEAGTSFTANIGGQSIPCHLSTVGGHYISNALCLLTVAHVLKLDLIKTAELIATLSPLKGRGKIHQVPINGGTITLIDESYSGNFDPTRLALENLSRISVSLGGRKIAVIGEIAELGDFAPAYHQKLGQLTAQMNIHHVIGVGPLMQHFLKELPSTMSHEYRENIEGLLPYLKDFLRPGDILLLKGSHHSSKVYKVAEDLLKNI